MSRDIQDEERRRRFARNLRAARERARLTQAGMAAKLGMADEVYARYERAKMWPSIDKLCLLCDILECSVDSLLGLDEGPPTATEPPPPEDPQPVRRLMRQLRKARLKTVRLVGRMLNELDACARGDDDAGKRGKGSKRVRDAMAAGVAGIDGLDDVDDLDDIADDDDDALDIDDDADGADDMGESDAVSGEDGADATSTQDAAGAMDDADAVDDDLDRR